MKKIRPEREDLTLRSLYDAIGDKTVWSESIGNWRWKREQIAGPLERKRRVDRTSTARAIGLCESELDLDRYLYSVELWIALVAQARLLRLISGRHGSPSEGLPCDLRMPCFDAPWGAVEEVGKLVANDPLVFADFGRNPSNTYGTQIQSLLPKQIRHTTGAYFTPAWLAQEVIKQAFDCLQLSADSSFLEPSCGPGVFLSEIVTARLDRGWMDASTDLAESGTLVGYEYNDLWTFLAMASLAELQIQVAIDQSIELDRLSWHRVVRNADFLKIARDRLARRPQSGQQKLVGLLSPPVEDSNVRTFDAIVGNPPWINWEYLPPHYRSEIADLWPQLGIFDLKSLEKANCKEDIASLFTIAALYAFGSEEASLGFVLPQSLFQSSLLGKGLRTAMNTHSNAIRVNQIDEWTKLNPFEDVSNNTVTISASRGCTSFPVTWYRHDNIADESRSIELHAVPVSPERGATWMVASANELSCLNAIQGRNPYRGRTGVFTGGANAVYYLDLLSSTPNTIRVRNVTERAKRPAASVEVDLEPDHVYPVVTGRDISFWGYECSKHLICPHTSETKMSAVPPHVLKHTTPLTYQYFQMFTEVLAARKGFAKWEEARREEAFYAIQRIGEYSFAPYKVAWKYIASSFVLTVIQPTETEYRGEVSPLVNDKVMSIGLASREEAFYVCGVMSSYPFRKFVESHMISTQISPSVIKNLAVPRFLRHNDIHLQIAQVCEEGHRSIALGNIKEARECLQEINRSIALAMDIDGSAAFTTTDDPIGPAIK